MVTAEKIELNQKVYLREDGPFVQLIEKGVKLISAPIDKIYNKFRLLENDNYKGIHTGTILDIISYYDGFVLLK